MCAGVGWGVCVAVQAYAFAAFVVVDCAEVFVLHLLLCIFFS